MSPPKTNRTMMPTAKRLSISSRTTRVSAAMTTTTKMSKTTNSRVYPAMKMRMVKPRRSRRRRGMEKRRARNEDVSGWLVAVMRREMMDW